MCRETVPKIGGRDWKGRLAESSSSNNQPSVNLFTAGDKLQEVPLF